MLDTSTLLVFITACLALLLVPGPAVLYVIARSIDQGRLAGLVSVLGITAGTAWHILAAALGVSAILVSSALAFSVVKYLGAAYLIYLGIQKLRTPHTPEHIAQREAEPLRQVFVQGMFVNLLNPKVALFFFAFLPQFADPERGSVGVQVLLLGGILVSLGMLSDSMYALLAGTVRGWLHKSRAFAWIQRYFSGGVYIALGVATAVSGSSK
ncbi:MAG: LysE family translocator [Anaerolineae bacterium]|nr:LysE family translocator [Anaerolineae bacterium]